MSEQLELSAHVGPSPGRKIEEDFLNFHAANPWVYTRLVALAREWRRRRPGRKVGIGMLYEVLRWEAALGTHGDPLFKLNNNHRAGYARLIMRNEGDLDKIFDTRRLRVGDDG